MKFENREFCGERIELNNNEFDHCRFTGCMMVFNGAGKVGLSNNQFNECNWVFEGAAAATVEFMRALYSMGPIGRQTIVRTFQDVAPDLKIRH